MLLVFKNLLLISIIFKPLLVKLETGLTRFLKVHLFPEQLSVSSPVTKDCFFIYCSFHNIFQQAILKFPNHLFSSR